MNTISIQRGDKMSLGEITMLLEDTRKGRAAMQTNGVGPTETLRGLIIISPLGLMRISRGLTLIHSPSIKSSL